MSLQITDPQTLVLMETQLFFGFSSCMRIQIVCCTKAVQVVRWVRRLGSVLILTCVLLPYTDQTQRRDAYLLALALAYWYYLSRKTPRLCSSIPRRGRA